jgi:hypothetical protein
MNTCLICKVHSFHIVDFWVLTHVILVCGVPLQRLGSREVTMIMLFSI